MPRSRALIALLLALPAPLFAQAIRFDAATRVFRIDTPTSSYAAGVNTRGELQSLYFGAPIPASDALPAAQPLPEAASFDSTNAVTPQEYAGWGAGLYVEPALKVTFPDGNRDLVLHYVSHVIQGDSLAITLRDISRPVTVVLTYTVDPATGILGRSSTITNGGSTPITLEQAASASWNLARGTDYTLSYLAGRWAGKDQLQSQPVLPGEVVLESKRGSTGHQNDPWFAIQQGDSRDQDTGSVWFGALAWSGSWRITVERDQLQQVRVTGGFNPFDFAYTLEPGKSLTTPVFYAGFTSHGIGEASRLFHRFELTKILPQRPNPRPRPVLYNSWEATEFRVDEAGQTSLAEKAAKIGAERFVMDDGWFGQRKDDHAGLGDWYVNQQKFPHGLKPLIDKVHSLGMDFGLWVEPEMVNPNSDLYRKHPDWVLNFPSRPRTEGRNQLVLNLARPDVRDYVFHFLDQLVTENDIAFLKWDYNRNWSEPGWDAVPIEHQKEVYVAFVQNLYGILADLRKKHPKLEIESCSGGGGRVDLGIMALTDEVWPSDNTDPFDRLAIQNGFTYAYTPGVMMAWVTDSPNWANHRTTSLTYRFLSSMQGSLGVGANLDKWQPEDFTTAAALIAGYKQVRETVQHGSLYRLVSPMQGSEHSVTESVSLDKSQAVLFAFLHSSTMGYPYPRIFPRGLDPARQYAVSVLGTTLYDSEPTTEPSGPQRSRPNAVSADTPATASGQYWMSHGLDINLRGDFQATALRLDAH